MSITGSTDRGDGLCHVTVNHDPRVTTTDVPAGSVIVYIGAPSGDLLTGGQFIKLDDGATTNVHYIGGRSTLTGSRDLTAGTPDNFNIIGAIRVRRIARARFWISQNGFDVGANVATLITLKFFNTDGFIHAELDSNGAAEMIDEAGEFQFASQDIETAPNFDAAFIRIDDTSDFGIDDFVRIHNGVSDFEYQRVLARIDANRLDLYDKILKSGTPAWALDSDVSRVFEFRDLGYVDQDQTDEIHLRMIPRAGDSDCRLHWWIEYEGAA